MANRDPGKWRIPLTGVFVAGLTSLVAASCGSSEGADFSGSHGTGGAGSGGMPSTQSGSPSKAAGAGGGSSSGGSTGSPASGGTIQAASGGNSTAAGAATQAGGAAGTAGRSGSTGGSLAAAGSSGSGGGSTASTPEACPATAGAMPGETTQTVMVGGMARTYVRHIPPGYTGKAALPVVIDFHPLGGTGASWKNSTGWLDLADDQGIIMIWPDGYQNSWNAGRCCRAAMDDQIDDVGFTRAIVAALRVDACIDSKRVYATGCSNGGGMAFRVACDAADVIAGVAPVDFGCVTNSEDKPSCGMCAPARPISEILFRGTADTAVPFEGGLRAGGSTNHPGAEETLTEWGRINQCTGMPEPLAGRSGCEAFPICEGGVRTALCTVQNGSHCGSYQSFRIAEISWEVLQEQTLP